jgi:hypothetical protein
MAERPTMDPAAMWRDAVAQWEKGLNELSNRAMASDEFSRGMNQTTGLVVGMQQSFAEAMGRTLAGLNMPSRADIAALGERLQAMETELARIAAAVDRLASASGTAAPVSGPPRTRRPPSRPGSAS